MEHSVHSPTNIKWRVEKFYLHKNWSEIVFESDSELEAIQYVLTLHINNSISSVKKEGITTIYIDGFIENSQPCYTIYQEEVATDRKRITIMTDDSDLRLVKPYVKPVRAKLFDKRDIPFVLAICIYLVVWYIFFSH